MSFFVKKIGFFKSKIVNILVFFVLKVKSLQFFVRNWKNLLKFCFFLVFQVKTFQLIDEKDSKCSFYHLQCLN